MPDLVQLSIRALDYSTRPVRFAVGMALRFVRDDAASDTVEPPRGASAPAPEPTDAHPQTRPEPTPRRPSPKAARRAVRHEPTKGQAAAIREAQREAEWDHDGPGPNVVIDDAVLRAAQGTRSEP
jgi:hypothetical protein